VAALAGSNPCSGDSQGPLVTVQQVIARAQRLCETPRPDGGYPLTWYVEASLVGDMTAISAAAIRSQALAQ
jgi:hypothetical protein